MVGAAVNSGPRFAPHDPTLPAPWRALVDTSTGYIYYWNTETNVTQYEKPLPPQAPPLPAGPPPGAPVSATPKQSVQAAQLPSANVSGGQDAQGGRPVEQHSVVNGNVPTSQVVSTHGGGNSNYQISNPSIPGGSNVHSNTAGNPPENMYGTSNSNPSGHSGMHIQNSSHRPSSGMSGGPVHMNSSDPYGASGRHMHGSSGGAMRGAPASSVHVPTARSSHSAPAGNMQPQPKLATLPVSQRQQGMGGVHMPLQSRQMGHTNNSGPMSSSSHGTGTTLSYKRNVGDYGNNDQDPHKRPRVQGFSEPPPTLDVHSYLRQHEITVVGDNVPQPYMTFDAANFPPEIARELHAAGFSAPTPIQAQSWPVALQSRDIVAIAKTGSGKTLGYLLPAFLHLGRTRAQPHMGPSVLVLAPTRELATQIQDEAIKFGRSSRISCTCVYGGAPKGQQLRELERGADIVIATPGRLNDFLEMKRVSLRQVSYLVLDEADRMLDMGFEPQIRKIVKEIPPRRQTLMYTATWPKEVRKIAADLLVNPVQVNIGNTDQLAANKAITQHVEFVPSYEKQRRLEQILRSQEPGSKIIIFCSTKKMCDQLARSLGRAFGAAAIHGDKSQSERDHVLAQFKAGRSPVLVATDVAARGLDIKDIRVVINFDFPTGVEDYVHRIGRTGRAGATGVAFTFFSDQDSKYAKELIGVLEGANQKVPSELRDLAAKSFHPKGRGNRWEASGMGGRDSGFGGGRGDGRGDSFGGRGTWGSHSSQFDRRDRNFDRFNDRERIPDRAGGRDRYPDDKIRGRDGPRKYSSKDRGRSYSRSYSRSPARSRGRTPSRSLSRSRSRSYERYSDDHYRRSPYKGRGSFRSRSPYGSRSPRSPYRISPSTRGKAAVSSHVVSSRVDTKFSAPLKEHHISDSNMDHKSLSVGKPHPSEQSIAPGTMDAAEDVNQPFDREDGLLPEQENGGGASEGERIPVA